MKKDTVYSSYKMAHMMPELYKIKNNEIVSPKCMQIDLTNKCNSKCTFCYYDIHDHLDDFSRKSVMKKEVAMRTLDDFAEMGGKSVEITGGGEPLLAPYFKEFSQKARSLGLNKALVTNGILLDRHIDEVKDYDWVRVSLNAGYPISYQNIHRIPVNNHYKVVSNLEKLCAKKEEHNIVGVSVIVNGQNYTEVDKIGYIAKNSGANNIRISLAHTPEKEGIFSGIWNKVVDGIEKTKKLEDDNFKVFSFSNRINDIARKTQSGFCFYHHLTTAVGANGGVYPCCYFKGIKQYNLGNLNDESFKQIWNGNKRKIFNEKVGYDCKASCWMVDKNKFAQYITMNKEDVGHLNFP